MSADVQRDDQPGKVVGRRRPPSRYLEKEDGFLWWVGELQRLVRRPGGVFRFSKFEEADEWMRENTL